MQGKWNLVKKISPTFFILKIWLLLKIYVSVFFLWQSLSLGMLRSDLMLETHPCSTFSPFCCWKQVEINTIASGFGWMGPASGLIHRYIFLNFLLRNRPPLCVFPILPSIFLWFRLLLHMDYYSVFLLFLAEVRCDVLKNFDLLLESKSKSISHKIKSEKTNNNSHTTEHPEI